MPTDPTIEAFWQTYLASLPAGSDPSSDRYEAWYFGDNEALANELGALVAAGVKTATCAMLWEYEAEEEALPQVGELSVITDWAGEPLCIIETTEVEIKPYNEVDEQFAYEEGEGDRSLAYWRQAHWSYFTRRCDVIGRELHEAVPLVCERFRVVFKPAA